jgi:hypothetical protein
MSIGLGQMLIGGLLGSQMFGGKEEEQPRMKGGWSPPNQQQPTQVASNNTSGGGFLSGISNSMFKGMSQEQVARLGQGFNSMRLEPDDSLAASFQSTIDNARKKTNRNATVEALVKMGKPNLANLVSTGAMDVGTAMTLAFKEVKGDVNGTQAWMETFRSDDEAKNSLIDSYRALIESAKGDPVAIRKYVDMFSNDFGVGVKDLKDTTSEIQIQQKDGMIMGEMLKEGQKYTIVTDEFGVQTLNVIEGAFGESNAQQYTRELTQAENTKDVALATKNSNEAFIKGTSAIDSVEKYMRVMRTLKNPDGSFDEDAITGWATKYLPSFTDDQAIIKSVANLMGIDVINMATFGALSEREMQMAMQTNLDTSLPPDQLYGQIKMMIESRQKLAQAMFTRSQRIAELGSWKAYKAEQIIERQGHLKSRYKVMNDEVKQAIRTTQYQVYQQRAGDTAMDFNTWNEQSTMTGYEAWSYLNWHDRAEFIANLPDMTYKKFHGILGGTEFAHKWWEENEGVTQQ